MSMGQYSSLAGYYDALNSEVDYAGWAEMLARAFERYGEKEIKSVLDLACGTGSVTLELAKAGFDMTALDISPEMLSAAYAKASQAGLGGALFLNQDMSDFELYGTVDAAVCCLDSVNYLTEDDQLDSMLACVHNYVEPGGLFVFDVNTPYKFRKVYGNRDYVLERDGLLCAWQNCFDAESGLCDFELDIFAHEEKGLWRRMHESQTERMYERETIEEKLRQNGFKIKAVYSDMSFTAATETDERWHFAAVREL